jgi:phosphoenolpyruvate carboxylase
VTQILEVALQNVEHRRKFSLKSLRAIPFVGAWSQLKQNVTWYFGVGTHCKNWNSKESFQILKSFTMSLYISKRFWIIARWR